jgi:ketosteroid isomerase-like protein
MNNEDQTLDQIRAMEAERQAAMTAKDTQALNALLDDELTYVHSTGRLMTKAEYLKHVASDDFSYVSITPLAEERHSVTDAMVMFVQQLDSVMQIHGKRIEARLSTVSVWRRAETGWKLVGSAASRIAA